LLGILVRAREIPVVQHDLALGLEHFRVLGPEFIGAVICIRSLVPVDDQRIATAHGGPRRCRNNRDAICKDAVRLTGLRPLDLENVEHTVDLARARVIEGLHVAIEVRTARDYGEAHIGLIGIDTVLRFAGHDGRRVHAGLCAAGDTVILHVLERHVFVDGIQLCGLGHKVLVGNFGADRLADNHAGFRVTVAGRDSEPGRSRLNQLHSRSGADLPHEVPVARQAGASAHALTTVFPREAVRGLHDAEGHRVYADFRPLDVEFFGDEHGECRANTLADFGLVAADDDVTVGLYLDEKPQLPFVDGIGRETERGDAEYQASGGGRAADEELAAAEFGCGCVHLAPPLISAARWIALRMRG
jgi:hypothetical protein